MLLRYEGFQNEYFDEGYNYVEVWAGVVYKFQLTYLMLFKAVDWLFKKVISVLGIFQNGFISCVKTAKKVKYTCIFFGCDTIFFHYL